MNDIDAGTHPNVVDRKRYRLLIEGVVQGVGFRPYVHRLASERQLGGSVSNSNAGVAIDIEGPGAALDSFLTDLTAHLPALARVDRVQKQPLAPRGLNAFAIADSESDAHPTALIPPDIATCPACMDDIFDPTNRRFRYPFTNCTDCGPRFSIVEGLPYDRPRTTMARFSMCDACAAEYSDPQNRRFHAQPIACPVCGPQIELRGPAGEARAGTKDAIRAAADALREGSIVALKGLGGYQLLVDARNDRAVKELRRRKRRPDKPFAVMFPSIDSAASHLEVSPLERELLTSQEAPIVLIKRRVTRTDGGPPLCVSLAPDNPDIGAMLPYTPLHHLLMSDLLFPVVATSGNVADEPMIIDDDEAIARLGAIADCFLTHNRPIASAVDDSVVRVVAGRPLTLRGARGYAPWAMDTGRPLPSLVAYGGHLKSSCAVTAGSRVIVGPHIGDLESAPARRAWSRSRDHLSGIHDVSPSAVVCDPHPDYYTTRAARDLGTNVVAVQHHVAHVAACMAENELEGPVLGIVWDGTGYGDDGTIWGGEFILVNGTQTHRIAHLRPFRLPGGERAIREPWRAALGVLFETFGEIPSDSPSVPAHVQRTPDERRLIGRMLSSGLNAPLTSSAGRLFDAAASLTGIVQRVSFEGQAAMRLEHSIGSGPGDASYEFCVRDHLISDENLPLIVDWVPAVHELLWDVAQRRPVAHVATAFHNGLTGAIVDVAQRIGEARVVLTGGCFQNQFLTERTVAALKAAGFSPYWHRRLPPNDGGLAAGQALYAARVLAQEAGPCV